MIYPPIPARQARPIHGAPHTRATPERIATTFHRSTGPVAATDEPSAVHAIQLAHAASVARNLTRTRIFRQSAVLNLHNYRARAA